MKIYNQSKTQQLYLEEDRVDEDGDYIDIPENLIVDLNKGKLISDKLITHINAREAVEEKWHYKTIAEYPNGGKDVERVVDVVGVSAIEEHDEEEDILIFIPYTESESLDIEKNKLREWRAKYFEVIDRAVWYDNLSDEQKAITKKFRKDLLDITISMEMPEVPDFIQAEIKEV